MADTQFWQNLFGAYQSLPDWIKALWIVVPPGFILGLVHLLVQSRTANSPRRGELIYSVYRNPEGQLQFVSNRSELEAITHVLFLQEAIQTSPGSLVPEHLPKPKRNSISRDASATRLE